MADYDSGGNYQILPGSNRMTFTWAEGDNTPPDGTIITITSSVGGTFTDGNGSSSGSIDTPFLLGQTSCHLVFPAGNGVATITYSNADGYADSNTQLPEYFDSPTGYQLSVSGSHRIGLVDTVTVQALPATARFYDACNVAVADDQGEYVASLDVSLVASGHFDVTPAVAGAHTLTATNDSSLPNPAAVVVTVSSASRPAYTPAARLPQLRATGLPLSFPGVL